GDAEPGQQQRLKRLLNLGQQRRAAVVHHHEQEIAQRLAGAEASQQLLDHCLLGGPRQSRAGEKVFQIRRLGKQAHKARQFVFHLSSSARLDGHVRQGSRIPPRQGPQFALPARQFTKQRKSVAWVSAVIWLR